MVFRKRKNKEKKKGVASTQLESKPVVTPVLCEVHLDNQILITSFYCYLFILQLFKKNGHETIK